MIELVSVTTAEQRQVFVDLAWTLRSENPAWVPPWRPDLLVILDPERGDFFQTPGNRLALYLARKDGQWVGRIAAIRNEVHLEANQDDAGFFGFFECIDDVEVAGALLARAETWLKEQGLKVVRGPANLNIQEEAGLCLDSFDMQPMAGMTHTPPYYISLLEAAAYAKARDLLVFCLPASEAKYDQLARIAVAAERRTGITVRCLNMNRLDDEALFLALVFKDSWRDNWGAVPIRAPDFKKAYEHYRMFLIPELIFLAEVDGEPAGAFIAMPDMNVLIKECNGKMWPFGWWKMLTGRKRITRYRVFMMGVRPAFRRHGIPLIFLHRCAQELVRRKSSLIEFSWILEDNHETIAIIERIGGKRVQKLRLYEKALA